MLILPTYIGMPLRADMAPFSAPHAAIMRYIEAHTLLFQRHMAYMFHFRRWRPRATATASHTQALPLRYADALFRRFAAAATLAHMPC